MSDTTIKELLENKNKPYPKLHGQKELVIEPFNPKNLQPASYDLTLGKKFLRPKTTTYEYDNFSSQKVQTVSILDIQCMPKVEDFMESFEPEKVLLKPGQFLLGTTAEYVEIPNGIRASIEGKSSLARIGLAPHIAAGYIDPGFCGNITLEFINNGPWTIILRPGDKIAQIAFAFVDKPSERPYGCPELGSHYQGQTTVQGSLYGT